MRGGASGQPVGSKGFQQAAGGGLQRGFGSHVSLPTLDEQGRGALQQVTKHVYACRLLFHQVWIFWCG